jgi:DNA repair exonuclease SbcCD ATPase subunit
MSDNNDLINDVGVLKGKVDALATIANKLDVIIERLVDINDRHIVKVYDDMEKRRMENQEQIKEIHERIDDVLDKVQQSEKNVTEKIEKMQKCITEHNNKEKEQLDSLLKWKWQVAGGILVIAWLLSHVEIDTILKSLH